MHRDSRQRGAPKASASWLSAQIDDDPQGAGHRHARLQQILHEELDALVRDELSDPALGDVMVTSVELSVDYRNARVAVAAPAGRDPSRIERALERATPFLRARLVNALELKRVPLLRFVLDRDAELHRAIAQALGDKE